MKSCFRSLERQGVAFLLISGQASVLYGAATFSEDVDLWVEPTAANVLRLLRALAALRAHVYKLTPPLTVANMRFGHGFHFLVPQRPGPIYLDIMGRPPRVGTFRAAAARAVSMQTRWGEIPVVAIEDLVELKKTRRLADYDVITNLVTVRLAREPRPKARLLEWAVQNSFRMEERQRFAAARGRRRSLAQCQRDVARDLTVLQDRDVRCWRRIIESLRGMRDSGTLLTKGTPVRSLLA